jgi:AmmeMemoRadiSam system protein A
MIEPLSPSDKQLLLKFARESVTATARHEMPLTVEAAQLPPALLQLRTSFVTLTCAGDLRGCVGGFQVEYHLYEDVRHHAALAATRDYRFLPVTLDEVPRLEIEISALSLPQSLNYESPEALLRLLRPEVDGVILSNGFQRATFLPQVWERVPDPRVFLALLCEKMGLPHDTWKRKNLEVQIYQVEKFTEAEFGHP